MKFKTYILALIFLSPVAGKTQESTLEKCITLLQQEMIQRQTSAQGVKGTSVIAKDTRGPGFIATESKGAEKVLVYYNFKGDRVERQEITTLPEGPLYPVEKEVNGGIAVRYSCNPQLALVHFDSNYGFPKKSTGKRAEVQGVFTMQNTESPKGAYEQSLANYITLAANEIAEKGPLPAEVMTGPCTNFSGYIREQIYGANQHASRRQHADAAKPQAVP